MAVQNQDDYHDILRQDCWDQASHAFGTQYIYSNKSISILSKIKLNNFLALKITAAAAFILATFKFSPQNLDIVLYIIGTIAFIHLVYSLYLKEYKYEEMYLYYIESINDNYNISKEYVDLAKCPPKRVSDLKNKKALIDLKYQLRAENDSKYPLSDLEKREGMRYSLRNFQRSCAGCGIVPTDMNSTDCGVCGNFKF